MGATALVAFCLLAGLWRALRRLQRRVDALESVLTASVHAVAHAPMSRAAAVVPSGARDTPLDARLRALPSASTRLQ